MKRNAISVLIAMIIASLAGFGHYQSAYAKETVERQIVKVINYETPTENRTVVVYIDKDIPEEVQIAAEKYGQQYNICPEFLEAIAYAESRYIADVDSKDGKNKGLMQVAPRWHQDRMDRLGCTDLHDVDQNMHVAADYLSELFEQYEDVGVVLMAYNGDNSWKNGNLSSYAKKILKHSEELEEKHKK